jgi:hypothetical protein
LVTSLNTTRDRRFVEEESSIKWISSIDSIAILDTILFDDAAFIGLCFSQRYDTLVGLNSEILHQKLAFFSFYCRKNDVIAILDIVGQILLRVSVDDRVYEVESEVEVCLVDKKLIDCGLRGAWDRPFRRIGTLAD